MESEQFSLSLPPLPGRHWLILASSREQVILHRDSLLLHLRALGLRLNGQKSVLTPAQRTTFMGVCLDSTSMQDCLAPARIESIQSCVVHFKLGQHVSVCLCRRLLGLMVAASPGFSLGLLHMSAPCFIPLVD